MIAEPPSSDSGLQEIFPIRFGLPLAGHPEVETLGFKGYNLWRMAQIGLPVPHALVIGTGYCRAHSADADATAERLRFALAAPLRAMEGSTGLRFGSGRRPLLVSVRSGAPVSMPGMMQTLLNVGLCDSTVQGLLRLTGNPRLVWDLYRRFVQSYAEVVNGCSPSPFDEALRQHLRRADASDVRELDFHALRDVTRTFLALYESQTGQPFPQQPADQLRAAIKAVFESWSSQRARQYRRLQRLDDSSGTAVIVQRMVYGNAGGTSGSGVGFTRDPSTGVKSRYVDFMFNAQGEDVVSGRHRADEADTLAMLMPQVHSEVERIAETLEQEFRDSQEFEFTVQDGQLYMLQTRAAKRTTLASLRMAVDMEAEGLISPAEALARVSSLELDQLTTLRVAGGTALATGVPAGVGVASGEVVFDITSAQRLAALGRRPVLVRDDPSTEDIAGIASCVGLLCRSGGRTSHAAVVARQLDKVCIVGCESLRIDHARRRCLIGGHEIPEGGLIALDGASGAVYAGQVQIMEERPTSLIAATGRWRTPPAEPAAA